LRVLAEGATPGSVTSRRGPVEKMEFTVAIGDVGQATKVENLAWSVGTGCDG
jgi:hypothetical protein